MKDNKGKLKLDYDLRLEEVCNTILEKRYKIILLQFPEGLKSIATDVKDIIEERTGSEVLISADPCYGACDIPITNNLLNMDLIVQFGHSEIPNLKCSVPMMFIETRSELKVIPVVEKALECLDDRVGIITTTQHIHMLEKVAEFLSEKGLKAIIGKGRGRISHDGQILGCNFSSANSIASSVDCYLYIGSGNFHPIGVALATNKPVVIADPYLNEVRRIEDEKNKLLRQRHGAISKAKGAHSFGVLVGTKPGQTRLELALELEKLAEKHDKRAYILVLHEFSPMNLKTFKLDAYISTACPRIAIDDYQMYDAPMLTPQEFRIVLGQAIWEDYKLEELI